MKGMGTRLRKLRKDNDYTLRELGDKLNLSFSTLAMYEREERIPPPDKLLLLADFFSVSADFLLGRCREVISTSKSEYVPLLNKVENGKLYIKENLSSDKYIVCEDTEDSINDSSLFYYRIPDNSMEGGRITKGDMVLVHRTADIYDGNIALVYVKLKNKLLVRRYYNCEKGIILKADNISVSPEIYADNNFEIIGKIIKVEFKPDG